MTANGIDLIPSIQVLGVRVHMLQMSTTLETEVDPINWTGLVRN